MNRSSFNSFLRTNTYFITKNNSSCMHIFNIKSERRLFNQAQVKPVGVLPHRKRSKLSENSTFKLMPSKLALMAVQRQTAASSSASPARKVQQVVVGGSPISIPINPPNNLAQVPSFKTSAGQVTD